MNPSKTLKYEMGQDSKIPKHGLIQPGALAKGLGQSLKVMSTTRVNAEQRTSISKNRSYNATTSKLNKLADNSFHVHPCFDEKEDNAPFRQGAEMNQYTLTSGARARGQSLGINVEKPTLIDKNRSTTTTSSRNKPAKTSILVPHNIYPMEDDDTLFQEAEEKFDSDDMNDQRDNILQHMRKLWNNWRGSLHKNVKSKSLHEVLKDVPMGVDKSDWEWLVKEHFLSEKFKEASTRKSFNGSKLCMPHRTGSRPGGRDGNRPNLAIILFETRKKGDELVEPEIVEKYAKIHELVQSEPSLTNIEVVERCFGPQYKSHVVGFGGGITTNELKAVPPQRLHCGKS
uniref:TNP2-like transposon protein n=1 Tax=Solanum tuberosum TaxID=4113 RepID=M1AKV7_SOLTU